MVDDHPLGANLEAFHLSPRFWQLEYYAEDHVDQTKELVDDATQWNRVSEAHDIHPEEGGTDPRTNVAKNIARKVRYPKTLPPGPQTIHVNDGRCVGCVEHGTHDHPHVALDEKALPPILRLDHDVVVRKGDEPDCHGGHGHQCGKERPSKQSQGQV